MFLTVVIHRTVGRQPARERPNVMVIIIFTLCTVAIFIRTKSYSFFDVYYPTVLYVSSIALLYQLLCRGHFMWHFRGWYDFTSKSSELTQVLILFPATIVLYLRYLPQRNWIKVLYLLGFLISYTVLELSLKMAGEIVYRYGWNFYWSVFLDFCLFSMAWLHTKNRHAAWLLSASVTVFLMIWFHVPLQDWRRSVPEKFVGPLSEDEL